MEMNPVYRDADGEPQGVTLPEPAPELKPQPEPLPPAPIVLTNEERLEVENLALKAQVLIQKKDLFVQQAQAEIDRLDADLTQLRVQMKNSQKVLGDKYGIDFKTQQIEAGTGRIIPAPGK
jgi:hypothetical protein